jgi:5'-nucleotidase
MLILLTNDDGIMAAGLAAMYRELVKLGDVAVIAPETVQSATGHGITISTPLLTSRVKVEGAFEGTAVAGSPADCVKLAIAQLLPRTPDLVVSGINAGANVGINVFYSGTVAAAAEAAMLGVPAVAFSAAADAGANFDFPRAARLCRWVLDLLLTEGLAHGDLFNVNIPALDGTPPRGVRVVPQSTAEMEDTYHLHPDAAGRQLYRLGDDFSFAHQADSDVACLAEGFITVTPLHVDMTNHDRLASLSRRTWPAPPPD